MMRFLLPAALAVALMTGSAEAQETDTGRICDVLMAEKRMPNAPQFPDASAAIEDLANIIPARCQPGDVLMLFNIVVNPTVIIAQFCDLGHQIYLYQPPQRYENSGINPELVCSLVQRRKEVWATPVASPLNRSGTP
jgi:hypothetical protein